MSLQHTVVHKLALSLAHSWGAIKDFSEEQIDSLTEDFLAVAEAAAELASVDARVALARCHQAIHASIEQGVSPDLPANFLNEVAEVFQGTRTSPE